MKRQQNQVFIVQIRIFEFREKWKSKISSTDKYREQDAGRGVKQERKKGSGSVYSLGILTALRRMDTQEALAA